MTEPTVKSFQRYDTYGTLGRALEVAKKLDAEVIEVRNRYGAVEYYLVGYDGGADE